MSEDGAFGRRCLEPRGQFGEGPFLIGGTVVVEGCGEGAFLTSENAVVYLIGVPAEGVLLDDKAPGDGVTDVGVEVVVSAQGGEYGASFQCFGAVVEGEGNGALVGHEAEVEVRLVGSHLQTRCRIGGHEGDVGTVGHKCGGSRSLVALVLQGEFIDALVVFIVVGLLHRPVAHESRSVLAVDAIVHAFADGLCGVGTVPEAHFVEVTLHVLAEVQLSSSEGRNLVGIEVAEYGHAVE